MRKNGVAHFEIYADDANKLVEFYTTLFDWSVEPVPGMDYRMIKTAESGDRGPVAPGAINGGILTRPPGFNGNAWVNYVNVESLDASVKKAESLGARVTRPRTAVPGMGWFAMLMDPQSNHFALWQTDPDAK